jgi:hypothetical protein
MIGQDLELGFVVVVVPFTIRSGVADYVIFLDHVIYDKIFW